MLIATMNPCPCGYLNDPTHECSCTPIQIAHYRQKLSGPILDRIDLILNVDRVKTSDLIQTTNAVKNTKTVNTVDAYPNSLTSSQTVVRKTSTDVTIPQEHLIVKNNITSAIQVQFQRYNRTGFYNSSLGSHEITKYAHLTLPAQSLLQTAAEKLNLSARSYFKIIKVARTIADLTPSTEITPEHISESLALREQLFT